MSDQQDNDEAFDFWNDHSIEFLEMAMKRDFQETVSNPDGYGKATRECGDTIEFFLMADQKKLTAVSYNIKGCIFTHACANTIIKILEGNGLSGGEQIRETDILGYLKTLPEREAHCASLALGAFNQALDSLPN